MGEAELQQILAGCLKNDRKDQKALYKTFYGFAMGICLRYAVNRYEASEVMNQGFYKVFTKLDQYDCTKPFKAWLGRVMINTAINYYRSNLKTAYTDNIDDMEYAGNYDLPDHKLEYGDLLAMVQKLPQAYRTVFNLYAIEGYTHEEIGVLLGISDGTSKSNLFKAREKLKKMVIAAAKLPRASDTDTYYATGAIDVIKLNVTL
ncbi:RNA polymerase subunit sigma-24 [Mucilaginibacter sp. PPCGB 2223]|uniref:RNA polymerase sigma factor n=1 Tax=Mucilaginibacter sp. PPCGB 2223 TaxID=1886027 RepID=UPI000824200E|nr:sigma-70 family RNA polymerase sigma factor [Mucilaginibacter sp. PPCGB 2223]OCX51504.1 RNA polymerase subunit sigma-24 [Mucilaginibacter sp. PPCGB 2223]